MADTRETIGPDVPERKTQRTLPPVARSRGRSRNRPSTVPIRETVAAVKSPGASTASARRVVLISGAILLAYGVATAKKSDGSTDVFKRVYSAAIVTLVLSLLADFAPQIAGPFAVLIVLGLIATPQGQAALSKIGAGSKPATATK